MPRACMCHCDNLRNHRPGTFDWSDFTELDHNNTYGDALVDCVDYTLRCNVCGSVWKLQLDHTPVFPAYKWSEVRTGE